MGSEARIGPKAEAHQIAPFLKAPWTASIIERPNTVCRYLPSMIEKSSGEDAFFAGTIKSPRALSQCVYTYQEHEASTGLTGVSVFIEVGNQLNGHPGVLHGGLTATFVDECFGTFKVVDDVLKAMNEARRQGLDENSVVMADHYFTGELKVRYIDKIQAPGILVVTVKRVKKEGRKDWLTAEVTQWHQDSDGGSGRVVLCATAESIFITARREKLA